MAKKLINSVSLEGLLYEHKLERKITGDNSKNPGTEYIAGTISVATDAVCLNIVPVHFSYVTEKTFSGKSNRNYGLFNKIIDGVIGTVMANGKENAGKVHIDTAIDLNEFAIENDNGEIEIASPKRLEGGFVTEVPVIDDNITKRNFFRTDMLITKATRVEANEERQLPEKVTVSGYIFNFRREALPVSLSVTNPAAMNYFEGLNASSKEPVFTQVWGSQISQTIMRKTTTESAFGETLVTETPNTRKDYIITGAAKEPYVWDDEQTLTAKEVTEMMAAREIKLAGIKKNREDYIASTKTATKAPSGDYMF